MVIEVACTPVTVSVDGEPSVPLALVTNPAQPFKNAEAQIKNATHAAHTHPFMVVFTIAGSSGLQSACRPGTGVGSAEAKIATLWPNCMHRIDSQP